jgi:hypothetical protein
MMFAMKLLDADPFPARMIEPEASREISPIGDLLSTNYSLRSEGTPGDMSA